MKKLFCILFAVALVSCALAVTACAAEKLSVLQPQNDTFVAKSDLPLLKWSKVDSAEGYRVTILNCTDGEYIIRNKWVSSRSLSLSKYEDSINGYPTLKIWVGAMASESDDPGLGCISDEIIWIGVSDMPDVSVYKASKISETSVRLKMSVDKDHGSAITDSGFYFGTSSSISKMKKYSFIGTQKYDATTKGTKYMTIGSLEPDTVYYFRAYSQNGAGEEYTKAMSFKTEKEETVSLPAESVVTTPAYPDGVKINSSVKTVETKYVYKDSSVGRTTLVEPYFHLDPSRNIIASVDVDALKLIIDQFDVLNSHASSDTTFGSGFYYPSGGSTYCTTYARDVANAFGAAFPSFVCNDCELVKNNTSYMGEELLNYLDKKGLICKCGGKSSSLMAFHVGSAASQNSANDPFCFMMKHGAKYGWEHITENKVSSAMEYASKGYLTIGLYSDYSKGAGHVFVVYPTEDTVMHQAQAGAVNAMSDGSKNWSEDGGYRRNPSNKWIEYFVFKGIGQVLENEITVENEQTYSGKAPVKNDTNLAERIVKGDVNGNGTADISDAVLISQYLAGWKVQVNEQLADFNGDGEITTLDAIFIAQLLSGWSV